MNPNDHLQALCQVRGSRNKEVTKFKALIYLLGLPWTLIIWGHPELILRSFGNSIPNCFFFGGGSTFFCLGVIIRRTDHQSALPSLANQTVPQHLILEWCAAMAGWELEWSPVAVICPFFLLRSLHSP